MFKDLFDGRVVSGKFILIAGTTTSVDIPNGVVGIKLYSNDPDYKYNINTNPQAVADDNLGNGAFGVKGIMEVRVIQNGDNRKLKILPEDTGSIKVELWSAN